MPSAASTAWQARPTNFSYAELMVTIIRAHVNSESRDATHHQYIQYDDCPTVGVPLKP
jgi:hypothetical protein